MYIRSYFSLFIFCLVVPGVSQAGETWEEGAAGGESVIYYGAGSRTQQNLPSKLSSSYAFFLSQADIDLLYTSHQCYFVYLH